MSGLEKLNGVSKDIPLALLSNGTKVVDAANIFIQANTTPDSILTAEEYEVAYKKLQAEISKHNDKSQDESSPASNFIASLQSKVLDWTITPAKYVSGVLGYKGLLESVESYYKSLENDKDLSDVDKKTISKLKLEAMEKASKSIKVHSSDESKL